MLHRVPLVGLVLLALPAAAPRQGGEDPFAGIPGVTYTYYDVTGDTPAAIRKDMNTKRFVDPSDQKPVDSLSRWRYGWRMQRGADGQCDPSSVTVTFAAEVKLPRLTGLDTLPRPVAARWQRYYAALLRHEAGHVAYAWSRHDALLAALKASSCETMKAVGTAELDKIRAHDRAYDGETRHGASQGAVFP